MGLLADKIEGLPGWAGVVVVLALPAAPSMAIQLPLLMLMRSGEPMDYIVMGVLLVVPVVAVSAGAAYWASCRIADRFGFGWGHLSFYVSLGAALVLPWWVAAWVG